MATAAGTLIALIVAARFLPYPNWYSKQLGLRFITHFYSRHKVRVLGTSQTVTQPTLLETTWTTFKSKHMLMRIFFVEYPEESDPLKVLATEKKVAGLAVVTILQALIAALYYTISKSEDDRRGNTSVIVGVVAGLLARPALITCDRWFRYCAAGLSTWSLALTQNDQLYAGAALHSAMDLLDLQATLRTWRAALEELKVMGMRHKLRLTREKYLATDVPIQATSRVHESFAAVRSAQQALADWRAAVILLLRGATSDALKRAQVRAQRNLYTRIVRLELLAAPETLRQLDGAALARCATVFERMDRNRDGMLSRIEIVQACRRDEKVRALLGLPRAVRREDGSREMFEAVFAGMEQDDAVLVSYDEFKRIFAGISTAMAAIKSGRAQPGSASANIVKLLGAAKVEMESQTGIFGIIAPGRRGSLQGVGMLSEQSLVAPRDDSRPHTEQSEELARLYAASGFLRTPGPRRVKAELTAPFASGSMTTPEPRRSARGAAATPEASGASGGDLSEGRGLGRLDVPPTTPGTTPDLREEPPSPDRAAVPTLSPSSSPEATPPPSPPQSPPRSPLLAPALSSSARPGPSPPSLSRWGSSIDSCPPSPPRSRLVGGFTAAAVAPPPSPPPAPPGEDRPVTERITATAVTVERQPREIAVTASAATTMATAVAVERQPRDTAVTATAASTAAAPGGAPRRLLVQANAASTEDAAALADKDGGRAGRVHRLGEPVAVGRSGTAGRSSVSEAIMGRRGCLGSTPVVAVQCENVMPVRAPREIAATAVPASCGGGGAGGRMTATAVPDTPGSEGGAPVTPRAPREIATTAVPASSGGGSASGRMTVTAVATPEPRRVLVKADTAEGSAMLSPALVARPLTEGASASRLTTPAARTTGAGELEPMGSLDVARLARLGGGRRLSSRLIDSSLSGSSASMHPLSAQRSCSRARVCFSPRTVSPGSVQPEIERSLTPSRKLIQISKDSPYITAPASEEAAGDLSVTISAKETPQSQVKRRRRRYAQQATVNTSRGRLALVKVTVPFDSTTTRRRLGRGPPRWYETPKAWKVLPWAVIGLMLALIALLTILLTSSLSNNEDDEYLLIVWGNALIASLAYSWVVQELILALFAARSDYLAAVAKNRREEATRLVLVHDHKSYAVVTNLKRVLVAPPSLPSTARVTMSVQATSVRRGEGLASEASTAAARPEASAAVESSEVGAGIGATVVSHDYAAYVLQECSQLST